MTVAEWIEDLKDMPQDADVLSYYSLTEKFEPAHVWFDATDGTVNVQLD